MKKLTVLLIICVTVAMACGKKMVPSTDGSLGTSTSKPGNTDAKPTGDSPTGPTGFSKTATEPAKTTEPATDPNGMIVPNNQGKTLFVTKCASCHTLKNPGDYTADRWDNILKSMIPKAKLNASEASQITAYLKANAK